MNLKKYTTLSFMLYTMSEIHDVRFQMYNKKTTRSVACAVHETVTFLDLLIFFDK